MKLLLHSCCAPCSSAVIEKLRNEFDITVFYYNPNIYPKDEFERRLEEQKKFLNQIKIPYIECEYNPKEYEKIITDYKDLGEGSQRCYHCYVLRLLKTCLYAKENGFDIFCTTLSVSPHKNAKWINEIGLNLQEEFDMAFLVADFKKNDGYKRSLELSKVYDFYRQNYCGCAKSAERTKIKKDL